LLLASNRSNPLLHLTANSLAATRFRIRVANELPDFHGTPTALMHLSPRSTPPLCDELSTCRATRSVGRANSSRAACQCRHQIHQRDFCSFVRESNPPRPVAIKTEPTRGSCERMCSDTAREARWSPRSDRRTCRRYPPLDVDALSIRGLAGCRSEPRLRLGTAAAIPGRYAPAATSNSVFTRVRGYRRAKNALSGSLVPSASEVPICQTPGAAVPGRQSPVFSLLSPRSDKLRAGLPSQGHDSRCSGSR
jgi:hypothetical protein